jgi:acyl carrier protein
LSMIDKIIEIVGEELALAPSDMTVDLHYNSIPEWDSVAHMTLISALEQEFGITFQNEEIVEMTTISAIERIVLKHVAP